MTEIDSILKDAQSVAVSGHVRPDGDCVGSTLAVYNYIKDYYPDIKARLYLEPSPNIFKFMQRADEIDSSYADDTVYDLFIACDCSDTGRLGSAAKYFESAKRTLCIDHHVTNGAFADANYIFPDASSTCELVFELLPKLQAMNTGHDGSLSTGHANSPHDIISRIETMVLQGQDFPLNAIRQQIASGIDIIVQLGRLRDKSRRVLEISEVDGFMDGEIVLHTLYRFEETAVLDSGRIQGFLKKAGTLCHTDKLMAAGLSV